MLFTLCGLSEACGRGTNVRVEVSEGGVEGVVGVVGMQRVVDHVQMSGGVDGVGWCGDVERFGWCGGGVWLEDDQRRRVPLERRWSGCLDAPERRLEINQ